MHEQGICDPAAEDDRDDKTIMSVLLVKDDQRPWSIEDLARELGDHLRAIDAVERLHRSGLVHRTAEDLVFPTRAALHMGRIGH